MCYHLLINSWGFVERRPEDVFSLRHYMTLIRCKWIFSHHPTQPNPFCRGQPSCQSSGQTSCQPSHQRTPFFLQVIMMPSRSSTEKATSLTPSPWATRWAPISWEESQSKSLHIFRFSPSPQKLCFSFIISIFFDYLSQISKPCWSRNSARKPIWKRRWCLGTWG